MTSNGQPTRLYEVLRRGRHILLMPGQDPGGDLPPGTGIWHDQVEVVEAIDGLDPAGSIYLLRPDGYVAARGSAASPGNLLDYLQLLFGTAREEIHTGTGRLLADSGGQQLAAAWRGTAAKTAARSLPADEGAADGRGAIGPAPGHRETGSGP